MCRWIAYRGETIPLERYVTAPAHSLVVQSLRRSNRRPRPMATVSGWAGTGERAEPGLYREVRPAWSDENLRHLCRHIRSHLFFAHVRASTGTPITRPNCHPFACGRWMFMHNGLIGNWSRLSAAASRQLIPDEFYGSRIGTTDFGGRVPGDPGRRRRQGPGRRDRAHARDAHRHGAAPTASSEPLRFTAALANGQDLYAFRFSANDKANSLYYRESGEQRRDRVRAARRRARALEAGAAGPHDRLARQAGPARAVPARRSPRGGIDNVTSFSSARVGGAF